MTDTPTVGAALLHELLRLQGRIEVLEAQAARVKGTVLDMDAIDEARIDVDRAVDELGADVDAVIKETLTQLVEALKRRFEASGLDDSQDAL